MGQPLAEEALGGVFFSRQPAITTPTGMLSDYNVGGFAATNYSQSHSAPATEEEPCLGGCRAMSCGPLPSI